MARRPSPFVLTRTNVAFISDNVFIVPEADFWLPSVRRARLTNIKPITVANVCNHRRNCRPIDEMAPQDTTPPFLARRNSSSTFHWPRKPYTMRPVVQA